MKHIIKIFALALAFSIYSCGSDDKKEEKVLRPVKYQEIQLSGSGKTLSFSGTARTDKIINLSFRTNGIITEHNLKIGQLVKKGEKLGKLDNVQSRLSYERAVSSLNSAESQMNTAKLAYNRMRTLYEKGSASLSDFESAKNSFRTAEESYQSAKRGVEIEEEQIRYGFLYAPDDGIISSVNAELDENVSPGQTVAVLNAGHTMEVSLGLPESVINQVKKDMEVCINLSAIPGINFKGQVTEVSPAVDSQTSTYPVRVEFIEPSKDIKSGMAANVKFSFSQEETTQENIVVPAHAVGEDSKGRFVFLVEEKQGTAFVKKQKVTIGELTARGFIITSGLNTGQRIATAGLQTLLDGQEVALQ